MIGGTDEKDSKKVARGRMRITVPRNQDVIRGQMTF